MLANLKLGHIVSHKNPQHKMWNKIGKVTTVGDRLVCVDFNNEDHYICGMDELIIIIELF